MGEIGCGLWEPASAGTRIPPGTWVRRVISLSCVVHLIHLTGAEIGPQKGEDHNHNPLSGNLTGQIRSVGPPSRVPVHGLLTTGGGHLEAIPSQTVASVM